MPIGNVKKWESKDIPTPEEFNRIENSIQALDLEKKKNFDVLPISEGGTSATTVAGARKALGLGDTGGPVPIANGGTGATVRSTALKNLGAYDIDLDLSCCVSYGKDGDANSFGYGTGSIVKFRGVKVGNHVVCSAYISTSVSQDYWLRIDAEQTVVSAVASVYKQSTSNGAPECIVYINGNCAYIGSDEATSDGFVVTLTLM